MYKKILIALVATSTLTACTTHSPTFSFKGQFYECSVTGGKTEFTLGGIPALLEIFGANPGGGANQPSATTELKICQGLLKEAGK